MPTQGHWISLLDKSYCPPALWVHDKYGNKASYKSVTSNPRSFGHWETKEDALKSLLTLDYCTNCTNCFNCFDCMDCHSCDMCSGIKGVSGGISLHGNE